MTKKRFLLALALMLTAVGGAWAQNTVTWTQADLSGINLGSGQSTTINGVTLTANNGSSVYMDAVPALFFNSNNNEGFTFSVSEGTITQIVITASMFNPAAGWTEDDTRATWTGNAQSVNFGASVYDVSSIEFTISGGNSSGVELVKDNDTLWHLAVPAGNVTLTVDYYGQYTLDSVPTAEGWQVKVNGSPATVSPYTPGSALGYVENINETDSVELIPPAELRGTIKAVRLTESVAAPAVVEPITVTINQSDWGNATNSFTVGGVTVSAGDIDADDGNLMLGGSFSTTLGNFTSIVVTTFHSNASGTGWSGDMESKTWSGTPASSVSFSGDFMGMGLGQTTIVCTIQPNN